MASLSDDENDSLTAIREQLTLRTSPALTQTILDLVASGQLPPGARLPTIRDLAAEVGMSRSAVGQSWAALAARGMIETRRRGGTRVLGKVEPPHAKRYESMLRSTISTGLDLGNLRSDTLDYPDLAEATRRALALSTLNDPFALPIIDELAAAARASWPFPASDFLTTHGLVDGLELALSALVSPGDKVIVENPTHGRIFDILEAMSATALPVSFGPEGPDIAELRRAMISKPVAFIYQPQGSAPSGRSVSSRWIGQAAETLDGTIPIIELSQFSLLHADKVSLGAHLPEQVLHVRSYNFFFGSDLRLGIVGGNPDVINAMWMRLTYSSRFVSRLLQAVLAHLLTDPTAREQTRQFVAEVKRRHHCLQEALREHGFEVEDSAGPSIWLPVPDEHSACTRLSHLGIAVHPGRFFLGDGSREQRVHVSSAMLRDGFDDIAAKFADACRTFPSGF